MISPPFVQTESKEKFLLLHHWEEYYLILSASLKQFPKRERHSLGHKIDDTALSILDYILLASQKSNQSRLLALEKLDREIAREKILIRLSHKMGVLSDHLYFDLEKRLLEMGRMTGGWLKYEKNKAPKKEKAV